MTLASMESRFFELKGKLAVGQLAEDEFKREMEKLRFQDRQGRWWMIGAQSGKWYYYDGTRWLPGQPPEPEEPAPSQPTNEPETGAQWPGAIDASRATTSADISDLSLDRRRAASPPPQIQPVKPAAPFSSEGQAGPGVDKPITGLPPRLRQPAPRRPTLGDRVREEMTHVHVPDVHVPAEMTHLPDVHAPASIRRFPPILIIIGAALVGLFLVAAFWLAVDNFIPGKPISSFLSRSSPESTATPPALRVTPTAQAAANVDSALAAADDLTAKSQLGSALSLYQNASRSAPGNADVYVHWARALALSGQIQEAVSTAQKATSLNQISADAYAELSRALAWSGKTADAVQAGEKAVQLDGQNATAHAFLAESYLRAGRRDDADKEASSALLIDEKNVDANRAAGWVSAVAGRKSDAVAAWERVTSLAPTVYFYHYEFGQVDELFLGDPTGAATEYGKAAQLFGPYVPSYLGLGRVYLGLKQPDAALSQFQKALTFDDASNDAWVGVAQAFQAQGRCEQAVPYYQKSLQAVPNGNQAIRGLADCGALPKGQSAPQQAAQPTPGLLPVPTSVAQAQATSPASTSGAAGGTGGGGSGRIAYSVFDGQFHLYTSRPDGSDRVLVADSASSPAFSPEGSQLLFVSWSGDSRGIHRIALDGSGEETVSLHAEDILPTWSSDGTHFAFATRAGQGSDASKRAYRIRISDPSSQPNQDPPDFIVGQYPSWGPGNRIVFRDCGLPTEPCGLAVIDSNGTGKRTLTNINSTAPAWSPDGKLIAFTSDYGGNWDLYVINSAGGSPSRLTTDPAEDGLPVFSPDGKQIAFVSQREGKWQIWAMGIDGSNQHKLFDLGGELGGSSQGSSAAQPGQAWYEQRIDWTK